MASFWDNWPAWEKMVLILAAAIVVTVLAGLAKLGYQNWQMRRFTRIEARQRTDAEKAEHKSLTCAEAGIPFGIRAIQSGIEVEGVWNSSNNSPVSSVPPSPRQAGVEGVGSGVRSQSQPPPLTMPAPVRPPKGSSPPSSRTVSRTTSPEGRETVMAQSNSSFATAHTQQYRPRRSSGLRFSSADLSRVPKDTQDAQRSSEERTSSSSLDSRESCSTGASDTATATRQLNQIFLGASSDPSRNSQLLAVPRSNGPDLQSLASHRKSQAAEMGQLIPRSRPASPEPFQPGPASRCSSPFAAQPERTTSRSGNRPAEDPFRTPSDSRVPSVATSQSSFDAANSDSSIAQRESAGLLADVDLSTPEPAPEALPAAVAAEGGTFDTNRHRVIRKVNSGFEILRPGSFAAPDTSNATAGNAPAVKPKAPKGKLHKEQRSPRKSNRSSAFFESV